MNIAGIREIIQVSAIVVHARIETSVPVPMQMIKVAYKDMQ